MESMSLPYFPGLGGLTAHPACWTSPLHQSYFHKPERVLFLCTENSTRSQMAEALLRHLSRGAIEVYSAGSSPAVRIHPNTRRVMEAVGINMHEHYPKHFERYRGLHFDVIVTVCERVREICPTFPGNPKCIHWKFPDPADATGSIEEQYVVFQQVGLQITTRLRLLMTMLNRKYQKII